MNMSMCKIAFDSNGQRINSVSGQTAGSVKKQAVDIRSPYGKWKLDDLDAERNHSAGKYDFLRLLIYLQMSATDAAFCFSVFKIFFPPSQTILFFRRKALAV